MGKKKFKHPAAYIPCDLEFPVEENPFESLAVDLTYRCNMQCSFCYNPERKLPDMEPAYFEEVCSRLPYPVAFKFLGGEPALHPRLLDFFEIASRYGHTNYMSTNGLVFTDPAFLKEFSENSSPLTIGISLDGGISRKDVYEYICNSDCLGMKMEAFRNLVQNDFGRVCLTAIIIRDFNEDVIPELLELAGANSRSVRYIHFRSAARVGRWQATEPYTMAELKEIVGRYFSGEQFQARCFRELHCETHEDRGCCFRFRPTPRLQVSLIEFATQRSAGCPKRGRLVDRNFRVQSFFEQIMKNSDRIQVEKTN